MQVDERTAMFEEDKIDARYPFPTIAQAIIADREANVHGRDVDFDTGPTSCRSLPRPVVMAKGSFRTQFPSNEPT